MGTYRAWKRATMTWPIQCAASATAFVWRVRPSWKPASRTCPCAHRCGPTQRRGASDRQSTWLGGSGAVPLYNLMEDAATAEISRSQLWQWRVAAAPLDDGHPLTAERYGVLREEELRALDTGGAGAGHRIAAAELLDRLVLDDDFIEFLTLPAYDRLLAADRGSR